MAKKISLLFLISLFGIALVFSTAIASYGDDDDDEDKSDKKISGYVKEYKTKIPISKAKVKLYKKSGKFKDSDKTNSKGKYIISDLSEGTYKIKVSVPGYRNPKDVKKDSASKTVKIKNRTYKNLYLQKAN